MKTAIVIPARLASTRLPRKLLLDLCGKTVLERTFEQAKKARLANEIIIAADAEEIAVAAREFGARVIMTSAHHQSGTERIAEAAASIDAGLIVNIQGDEPEIDPAHIDALIDAYWRAGGFAATLACPFPAHLDPSYPAAVKAVLGERIAENIYDAEDFSRSPPAGAARSDLFLHVGAYAYARESLLRFVAAPRGVREAAESLEQLRILEMGEKISVRLVDHAARGVDTEQDIEAARRRISKTN